MSRRCLLTFAAVLLSACSSADAPSAERIAGSYRLERFAGARLPTRYFDTGADTLYSGTLDVAAGGTFAAVDSGHGPTGTFRFTLGGTWRVDGAALVFVDETSSQGTAVSGGDSLALTWRGTRVYRRR